LERLRIGLCDDIMERFSQCVSVLASETSTTLVDGLFNETGKVIGLRIIPMYEALAIVRPSTNIISATFS